MSFPKPLQASGVGKSSGPKANAAFSAWWWNFLLGAGVWAGFGILFAMMEFSLDSGLRFLGGNETLLSFLLGAVAGGIYGFFCRCPGKRGYRTLFGSMGGMWFVDFFSYTNIWIQTTLFADPHQAAKSPVFWIVLALAGPLLGLLYSAGWTACLWIFWKLGEVLKHPNMILFGMTAGALCGPVLMLPLGWISPHLVPGSVLWSFFCYSGPAGRVYLAIVLCGILYGGLLYGTLGRAICWKLLENNTLKFTYIPPARWLFAFVFGTIFGGLWEMFLGWGVGGGILEFTEGGFIDGTWLSQIAYGVLYGACYGAIYELFFRLAQTFLDALKEAFFPRKPPGAISAL